MVPYRAIYLKNQTHPRLEAFWSD